MAFALFGKTTQTIYNGPVYNFDLRTPDKETAKETAVAVVRELQTLDADHVIAETKENGTMLEKAEQ